MVLRDVNLLHPEIAYRRMLVRHVGVWSICLLLLLGGIGAYYLVQIRVILKNKNPLAGLTAMQTHLGERIKEIQQLQTELDRLAAQQADVAAIGQGPSFATVLYKLAAEMPPAIWLSRFTIAKQGEAENSSALHVELEGYSRTNLELGNLLNRINRQPIFAGAVLDFANEVNAAEGDDVAPGFAEAGKRTHFQIRCTLAPR